MCMTGAPGQSGSPVGAVLKISLLRKKSVREEVIFRFLPVFTKTMHIASALCKT